MPKFTIEIIEAARGEQIFYDLCIDGIGSFTQFEKEIIGTTYKSEFMTLVSYMKLVADLHSLPRTKFHELSSHGVKEYEFKTKHLRAYCIKTQGGKIVVLFGQKTNQSKDLSKFKALKKQYLNSLK